MKNLGKVLLVAAMLAFVAACGGSSSGSSDTVDITTIDQLPKATGPVVGASASVNRSLDKANATTGTVLMTLSADDFGIGKSQASCETAQKLKQAFSSANQGDQILCFVTEIFRLYEQQTGAIDIYDGAAYHDFKLNITDESGEGAPDHVRFTIGLADGKITNFKMYECRNGVQTGFLSQTIEGTTFDMINKGSWGSGSDTGSYYTKVDGVLNTNGTYQTKTINNAYVFNSGNGWSEATVEQGAETFSIDAYDHSSDGENIYIGRAYSSGTLLGADDLETIAIGEGASKYVYAFGEYTNGPLGEDQGWAIGTNAIDDTMIDTYPPSTPRDDAAAAPTLSEFDELAGETVDCAEVEANAEATITGDIAELTACAEYVAFQSNGGDWINCYEETNPEPEPVVIDFSGTYNAISSGDCGTNTVEGLTSTGADPASFFVNFIQAPDTMIGTFKYDGETSCSNGSTIVAAVTYTCSTCVIDNSGAKPVITLSDCMFGGNICDAVFTKQ